MCEFVRGGRESLFFDRGRGTRRSRSQEHLKREELGICYLRDTFWKMTGEPFFFRMSGYLEVGFVLFIHFGLRERCSDLHCSRRRVLIYI